MVRVKVCYTCKKFCPIHPDNYEAIKKEEAFENHHKGHSLQVADLCELEKKHKHDEKYEIEKIKIRE